MRNPLKIVTNGILNENPTFVQCIGLCPTLAISTSVMNGMGMGVAAMFILIASNAAISLRPYAGAGARLRRRDHIREH